MAARTRRRPAVLQVLRLYGALFAQMLKVRLAYKGDFLADLVATALGGVASLLFVLLFFRKVPDLAGWSREQVLVIQGLSMMSYGLFGSISWNLYDFGDRYVIQGRFDRVLLRPANSYLQVLFDSFRIPALAETVMGAGVVAFAVHRLDLAVGVRELCFGALAVGSGAVIFTCVFSMLASVSFHFEDRIGISPPVFNMIAFSRYPQSIYPGVLRFVLRWIIPFAFVAYHPAQGLLGRRPYEGLVLLTPVVALAFVGLTALCWRLGVRRYESTGS